MSNLFKNLVNSGSYNLKNIFRYSNCKMMSPESTAEHTILMQLLAIELYNMMTSEGAKEFDIKELTYRILIHDLDESVLCDIPRDIKYYNDDSKQLITKISDEKLSESGYTDEFIKSIDSAKHNCVEGELTGYLDVLQSVIKLREEYLIQSTEALRLRYLDSINNLTDRYDNFSYININSTPWLSVILKRVNKDCILDCNSIYPGKDE